MSVRARVHAKANTLDCHVHDAAEIADTILAMIYDHLDRIADYRGLEDRFAKAIDWLTGTDLDALTYHPVAESGQHKMRIQDDDVFAMLNTYPPAPHDQIVWESHRDYADIQVIVSGYEQMGIASLNDNPPVKKGYDPAIDAAFYDLPAPGNDSSVSITFVPFSPDMFAIYLPQDIHAPNLALAGHTEPVRKVVVKVRVG